ncbi:hypothetical protein JMJ35_001891 [Cladonia borealis]|uniref:DNA helicase n=1 Tax=Cladonia borealis TaxID=184061 RepID=A0AA39R6K7_9LECA|nr:hypothetical protein JMJ35_001891 [Cladonia borealis]
MAPQPLSPPTFATSQLSLLAAEQSAETSSTASLLSTSSPTTLSRAGLAITNLVIGAQRTGLGGKTVLELELDSAIGREGVLGEHGVRVGDIVRVGEQPRGGERKRERVGMEKGGVEGVVVRVGERGVWVAVGEGEGEEGLGGRVWVVKLANDVTYKRMNQIMERMQKMEEKDYTTLTRILFGLESPTPVAEGDEEVKFIDETLNESQRNAVRFALASREVALVHGPPGTGKTYTLIEIILQLLQRKKRILVCGPSNISVDNIVERLAPHKVPMIRLGHPARLLPSVLNHSLDVLTQTSEAAEIVKDVRKEMDAKQASIKKTRNGRERRAIYTDMKDLRKEYREREKQCVNTLVGGSQVVLATLHGAGGFQLRNEEFDVVIIDEASQALEAQCWIPLLSAKKVILAGDHLQLPPTIKSTPPKPKPKTDAVPTTKPTPTLETTLFDRLLTLHGPSIKRMLKIQYRMHEKIMRFPSDNMYSSALTAAPSVAHRLLTDLPYPVKDTDDTREPLIFYDTQGGDFPETNSDSPSDTNNNETPTSKSKSSLLALSSHSNPSEAALILTHITSLTTAGIHPSDIAIITPYAAQLTYLSRILRIQENFPGLELGTVDGFQGREKEVVVISLVRSNGEGEVGFLREERRLNVGMTRARRGLVVVGDGGCVGRGSPFLKKWMEFLEEEADLRYPDVADLQGI